MTYSTCPSCKSSVVEALAEPDGRPKLFDSARTVWRIVKIAGEHFAAVQMQAHEVHRCNPNDVALTEAEPKA